MSAASRAARRLAAHHRLLAEHADRQGLTVPLYSAVDAHQRAAEIASSYAEEWTWRARARLTWERLTHRDRP